MTIDTAALKERVDLLTLIGADVALRKVAMTDGGEFAGPCPFCGGDDRLHVQPRRGRWFCRQCGDGRWRDAIAYVMRRDDVNFAEACARLGAAVAAAPARRAVPKVRARAPSRADEPGDAWRTAAKDFVRRAEARLWSDASTKARRWLRSRGLTDETIRRWGLGFYSLDDWAPAERWGLGPGGRVWVPRGVVIPWRLGGLLWQVQVRRAGAGPKYVSIRGGRPVIFGAETLGDHGTAVLVEGAFDVMLLEQEAGDLVGAVTLGSCSASPDRRAVERLLPVSRLLVALDADDGGERGAARLVALSARCRRVAPPAGTDVTEFFQRGGRIRDWVAFELAKADAAEAEAARHDGTAEVGSARTRVDEVARRAVGLRDEVPAAEVAGDAERAEAFGPRGRALTDEGWWAAEGREAAALDAVGRLADADRLSQPVEVGGRGEANGWRSDAQAGGWVEAPERAAACVNCPQPLAAGNLLYCERHRGRMVERFGYAVGDPDAPARWG